MNEVCTGCPDRRFWCWLIACADLSAKLDRADEELRRREEAESKSKTVWRCPGCSTLLSANYLKIHGGVCPVCREHPIDSFTLYRLRRGAV